MDNELKELLRSVMKEELSEIRSDIKQINQRFDGLEERFDGVEGNLGDLNQRFVSLEKNHNERFDKLELGQEKLLSELRSSTKHLEDTVKEHRLVIDLLQSGVKPEVEIKYKKD